MDDYKSVTRSNSLRHSETPSPVKVTSTEENGECVKSIDSIKPRKSIGTSRGKGISLNLAVSPLDHQKVVSNIKTNASPRSSDKNNNIPEYVKRYSEYDTFHSIGDSKYDFPLPPTDSLLSLDIDEQLRLLALKEMFCVELKDNIHELTTKLEQNENELHRLREVIQKSLYKELNNTSTNSPKHQRSVSNPRDEAITNTKNKSRRSLSFASNTKSHHQPEQSSNPIPESKSTDTKSNSTLWTNLSKPLHLIQQFDTMLSQEFEKSLIASEQQPQPSFETGNKTSRSTTHTHKKASLSISSGESIPSPLKSKSHNLIDDNHNIINTYSKQNPLPAIINQDSKTEDMLQTVSTSIWSFVNEVKFNVLSSLGETEEKNNASPYSSNKDDNMTDDSNIIDFDNGIVDRMQNSRINDLEVRRKLE